MIVFDTYAWIEYFIDGKNADLIESYLENNQVITPIVVLLEISSKAYREKWDIKKYINFIKAKSTVLSLSEEIIIKTGEIYNNIKKDVKDFGLIDATIFTAAIINKCKILTGDPHFKNLDNVEFLK